LYAAALVLTAVGIGTVAIAWKNTPVLQKQLTRRVEDTYVLEKLVRALATVRAAMENYAHLVGDRALPAPASLVGETEFNPAPDIRLREPTASLPGWRLQTADIVLRDAALSHVSRLLTALENTLPPWRLREIQIEAGQHTPGRATVTMVMEGVERDPRP
jgi:hypothetical protein